MSSAKRRINSTGRRKISRDKIEIRMLEAGADEPLKAKVSLDLSDETFPEEARVAVEAYHRSSGMRFDCGTVGSLKIPAVLVLDQVDRSGSVLFRVKVVDNDNEPGKILGSAERIQPKSDDDQDGRRSFFPIVFRDLGPDVWKVEAEYGDRPKLIINTRLAGFSHRLHESPMLQGLILPAAMRFVLQKLVSEIETGDDDDNQEGWRADWIAYCRDELGMHDDPAELPEERRADWVDEAVRKFCDRCSFIDRIRKMSEEG